MSNDSPAFFHASAEQAGKTISAAMRQWLPEKSWSEIRRLVRSGRVTLNGEICTDEAKRLVEQDEVRLLGQSSSASSASKATPRVRVIYLDEHLVIVEKPAGVTSTRHADERGTPQRRRQLQPALDELLPMIIARIEEKRQGKEHRGVPPPVRPVHRLDRQTTGPMVFARTIRAEAALQAQFQEHTIDRSYLAIAEGTLEEQTIRSRLTSDRGDGWPGSLTGSKEAKLAITHVRPLERLDGYTLAECRLETGRTHQIRIHLSELGHPLCGEKVYRQPLGGKWMPDHSNAPRLALHATLLGFTHPISGEKMRFESPLPADLAQFLDRLRASEWKQRRGRRTARRKPT